MYPTGHKSLAAQRRRRSVRRPLVHRQDVVDLNNNIVAGPAESDGPEVVLDRVAVMKAFGCPLPPRPPMALYAKPSLPGQKRLSKKNELRAEFKRLRETVPSTAGTHASDLTVINEAISLICDLEAQLVARLKAQPTPSPLLIPA